MGHKKDIVGYGRFKVKIKDATNRYMCKTPTGIRLAVEGSYEILWISAWSNLLIDTSTIVTGKYKIFYSAETSEPYWRFDEATGELRHEVLALSAGRDRSDDDLLLVTGSNNGELLYYTMERE